MTEDQIENEFKTCIQMVNKMFKAFQLKDYYVRLSLSDPLDAVKYIADSKTWDKAGKKLEKIIKDNKLKYVKAKGEASFYGPKIDYIVKDSLGREWQMSTLQLDLFMGKRLNLTYRDENGQEKNPVILHRGLTGSVERTLGILIEHFGGAFPLWLSPIQVKIIPVSDQFIKDAKKIEEIFKENNIRCEIDNRTESVGKKISANIKEKNPYALVIGEREIKSGKLAVRTRGEKEIKNIEINKFLEKLKEEIKDKR
jgi:threonyl-tRNA synthetase